MKKIALIPARSGSKSIPDKNLLVLNGKTLLERTIEEAIKSDQFDEIFVSTDSLKYSEIGKSAGASVPFLRPESLSGDYIRTIDVVLHFLEKLDMSESSAYLFLLQVTSPFRTSIHLREAVSTLHSHNFAYSLMSVRAIDSNHPYRMQTKTLDGFFVNYESFKEQNFQPRQELPKVYIRNGSIYANSVLDIASKKRLIGEMNLGLEMNSIDSINIDSIEDFWLAQSVVKRGLRN